MIGLGMTHTKAHMLRAVYEGVCFNKRWLYDLYKELGKDIYKLEEIRAIGGGVLNKLWMQIYANVNNQNFASLKSPQQSTALGAAIMGGVGVGIWDSYEEAAEKITIDKRYSPQAELVEVYDELYPIYRESYSKLISSFRELSEFNKKFSL
jgi:xylulokinase